MEGRAPSWPTNIGDATKRVPPPRESIVSWRATLRRGPVFQGPHRGRPSTAHECRGPGGARRRTRLWSSTLVVALDERLTQGLQLRLRAAGVDGLTGAGDVEDVKAGREARSAVMILDMYLSVGSGVFDGYRIK